MVQDPPLLSGQSKLALTDRSMHVKNFRWVENHQKSSDVIYGRSLCKDKVVRGDVQSNPLDKDDHILPPNGKSIIENTCWYLH